MSHDYFDTLVARPDHWKSFSLRSNEQMLLHRHSKSRPLGVTYDPAKDPDPRRQDAAKVLIPTTTNQLKNTLRVPMGTEAGHAYLVTWDAWFGAEHTFSRSGVPQRKTFQFASTGIWFEIQSRFKKAESAGLALVTARGYVGGKTRTHAESFGPNVTDINPLLPQVGTFTLQPERWTRYWALIDQRPKDWDLASLWVADAQTDPVQILDRLQVKAINGTIEKFWLEYNTSTSAVLKGRGPLVSYVRNIVMLRDVADPALLLKRPA